MCFQTLQQFSGWFRKQLYLFCLALYVGVQSDMNNMHFSFRVCKNNVTWTYLLGPYSSFRSHPITKTSSKMDFTSETPIVQLKIKKSSQSHWKLLTLRCSIIIQVFAVMCARNYESLSLHLHTFWNYKISNIESK